MSWLGIASSLNREQLTGDILHRPLGLGLGFCPAGAAECIEWRARFPSADVFADEVRLCDGNVKFGRGLRRIVGRVFNDQTFLTIGGMGISGFFRLCAKTDWQNLQAEITADTVLQMNDVIAFFEFGEVNVE